MNTYNVQAVIAQAKQELREEHFRAAVEREKTRLRQIKWWHKLLPFKIVIIWR